MLSWKEFYHWSCVYHVAVKLNHLTLWLCLYLFDPSDAEAAAGVYYAGVQTPGGWQETEDTVPRGELVFTNQASREQPVANEEKAGMSEENEKECEKVEEKKADTKPEDKMVEHPKEGLMIYSFPYFTEWWSDVTPPKISEIMPFILLINNNNNKVDLCL